MRLRTAALAVALVILSAHLPTVAQPPAKVPRVGYLSPAPGLGPFTEAFLRGLREVGWVEGQNIAIEYRWAAGRDERVPTLAAELVRLKVDVIFAVGPSAARAAKNATGTIPITTVDLESDPVESGLVASLARPGGNLTGLFLDMPEICGKWLELLKEVVPRLSRVAALGNPAINGPQFRATEAAARSLRLHLQPLEVRAAADFGNAFGAAVGGGSGAVVVLPSPLVYGERKQIAELAARNRLPTIALFREVAEAGGLMAYGPSVTDMAKRAAAFVDRILKGTAPADLPVERPTRFELVINLKTAKSLGLTIPQSVLVRADHVIR